MIGRPAAFVQGAEGIGEPAAPGNRLLRTLLGRLILALLAASLLAACTPDKAMDFGPLGEIDTPPGDPLSAQILREFDGREFLMGKNDREAEVRLPNWPEGKRIKIPFWLGVNPIFPAFLRPTLGHIYVISEAVLVRSLGDRVYQIRAGSKMFKSDTLFEATHTRYAGAGKMLPTVVRFAGTRVITLPRDPPQSGTVTIKVPVLREVSLPMHTDRWLGGYASYQVLKTI